jgi:phospholipid transport system substrate-binding protein
VVTVLILIGARVASAGSATDQLRPDIERVIAVLQDPALREDRRTAERRQAIRAATDGVFDWTEMARRSLGRHWAQRTEAEQREFVGLFRELLERAYLGKIEAYTGEKIVYVGEVADGGLATVRTKLITKRNQALPIDYRMAWQGDRWRVYDVVIEGVGLVNNYRSQFDGVIRTASYEELLKRLRDRAALAAPAAGGA